VAKLTCRLPWMQRLRSQSTRWQNTSRRYATPIHDPELLQSKAHHRSRLRSYILPTRRACWSGDVLLWPRATKSDIVKPFRILRVPVDVYAIRRTRTGHSQRRVRCALGGLREEDLKGRPTLLIWSIPLILLSLVNLSLETRPDRSFACQWILKIQSKL
jgi:hypothetical protein